MQPLDIAFLSPRFWPETRRGAERFVREMADGLVADGHRPTLITSHRGRPSRALEGGLRVLRVPRPPNAPLVRRGFEDDSAHVPLSYGVLRTGSYDLVQAVHAPDALAANRWGRVTGRPSVFSYMGIPDRRFFAARGRRAAITERAVRGAGAVVSLSAAVARGFADVFDLETRVIHPPVDLEAFTPGGPRHSEPTVFCASAVDAPAKRVELLVSAFERVRAAEPLARLVLSDPGDPVVAAAVAGGRPGVEFAAVDDTRALADAYRGAWVTVLPSVGEAFGLVLAESLACGTPVVGSRAGGIPEIVDRESIGALFDDGEADLADAILATFALAADPATQAACRERALEFSRARAVRAYEELYADLLAGRT